jgi:hypothetical protein
MQSPIGQDFQLMHVQSRIKTRHLLYLLSGDGNIRVSWGPLGGLPRALVQTLPHLTPSSPPTTTNRQEATSTWPSTCSIISTQQLIMDSPFYSKQQYHSIHTCHSDIILIRKLTKMQFPQRMATTTASPPTAMHAGDPNFAMPFYTQHTTQHTKTR